MEIPGSSFFAGQKGFYIRLQADNLGPDLVLYTTTFNYNHLYDNFWTACQNINWWIT
jgi:hypothetical protein